MIDGFYENEEEQLVAELAPKLVWLQTEFNLSEVAMDAWEKEKGYLPIKIQDNELNGLKEKIAFYDCDNILETFYFDYQYEFPAVFNGIMVNNYYDLARAVVKARSKY